MRLKIYLKSENEDFMIPFNYNHILSSIIYNKIADLDLADKLHNSISFKFFTFSQINVPNRKITKKGIISKDGRLNFYISSPNDYLIRSLVDGFLDDLYVKFKHEKLFVEKIELLKEIEFQNKMEFKTLSPIIVRKKKEVDGKLKIWDLAPGDEFFKALEKNLMRKYLMFNDMESTDKKIKIYSEMKSVKRKRIAIEKGPQTTYNRGYMMDIILEGDLNLIKFAYAFALGEKNSMGFGMLSISE